jgi:hypothetical protein
LLNWEESEQQNLALLNGKIQILPPFRHFISLFFGRRTGFPRVRFRFRGHAGAWPPGRSNPWRVFFPPEKRGRDLIPFYSNNPELFYFHQIRFSFGETTEEAIRKRKSKSYCKGFFPDA